VPSTHQPETPPELEAIVMKLLAPLPEDRFATGRDVAAAIAREMLVKQVLVDATSLEQTIAELVPRVVPSVRGAEPAAVEHHTQAAAPAALSNSEGTREPSASAPVPNSKRPQAREVRHVAIVTLRLAASVEPASLDDSSRRAFRRAIERSRAMLGEMAYKRGMRWVWTSDVEARAIAGLGDKPAKAAFDAAWLAVETHEALAGIADDLPSALGASLSIVRGIASGLRDAEGNLVRYVLHEPVTYLADALARQTPLGTTWVAGGVYRQVRGEFKWTDAPTLELYEADAASGAPAKNLPPTMRAYTLVRSLSRDEKAAEQQGASGDLVGRDAEKADLHAAYHAATSSGTRGITTRVVVGELGIGKTSLVSSFLAELPSAARVIRAECSPVRIEVPYSALADLVREAVGASGEESYEDMVLLLARVVGRDGALEPTSPFITCLAELASNQVKRAGEDEDATYRRKILLGAVRKLVGALAVEHPIVIVVDGLHWADKPTLELLQDLIKYSERAPVLVLLLTRPDDRIASAIEGKVRIELRGLSSEEQIRLVETRLNVREGVRQVCAELMPRVGGNPFYLLEMLDALLERGVLEIRGEALVREGPGDLDAMGLPSTLEQLLADRIHELPGAERVLIDWLAIAGGPLGFSDLAKLNAKLPIRATEEATMRLCARGLCDRKGDTVDFRHPLTRDVAYTTLDTTTRSRMHEALGDHLAETSLARGVSAAIVARHLVKGEAAERAAEFYIEAANAARNAYQTQLAVRYYSRAAQILGPSDPRRLEVFEALEATFRVLGRKRDRVRHLEHLRRTAKLVATPRAACLALLRTARFDLDEGRLARGLPVAKTAASLAHATANPGFEIEAELLVSELSREMGDVQGALAASDRALAACDPIVNPKVPVRMRADVLRTRGVLLRRVGRVREAVDAYAEAIAVFRKSGARRAEARAKNALAYAMFVQGRYEDAIALALESIRIDLSIGGRFQLAKTLTNIGHAYARLGDIARALAYLKRARDAHQRYGDQDGHADTLIVSAEVLLETGDVDAASAFVTEATQLAQATGNAYDIAHAWLVHSAVARDRRDFQRALTSAMAARRSAENQALVSYHFYAMALEAAARVDAGEIHAATLLATTALGAVEALQGCEYGLEIRVLCSDALKRAGSPQAGQAHQRAVDHAGALLVTIRDARFKRSFVERPLVTALFDDTPTPEGSELRHETRSSAS
jgi:tetratricopeptide (TPR) repeat protein